MKLSVLNVAYPCAPVGPDAVGGAEQILHHLDVGLTRAGHESVVVACRASWAAGRIVETGRPSSRIDDEELRRMQALHRDAVERVLRTCRIDVVHMHGIDFYTYLPPPGVPVLVTLHLPLDWYPPEVFSLGRPETYLHCVSESQRRTAPDPSMMLPSIENGVPVEGLPRKHARRSFVLSLGRICPEKGFHLAIEAARAAEVPLLLAGTVYPYPSHEAYFRDEIAPRLDAHRRFIGSPTLERKQRLLSAARAVLIPSLAAETSSLVAMEAFACGTPVIAFPKGALSEIVDHGRTGFLVDGVPAMAEAIRASDTIDTAACLAAARSRFSRRRMVERYVDRYAALIAGSPRRPRTPTHVHDPIP